MRTGVRNLEQALGGDDRTGRVVGVGNGNQASLRGNGTQHGFQGKAEVFACWDTDHAGTCGSSVNLIHRKSRNDDDGFIRRFEVSLAEKMNRLVDPVGKKNFLWL